MKRLTLFEFEDFHWLPESIRACVTNLIIVFHKMMGSTDMIADLIVKMKEHADFSQIVDMGSGSGGPMIDVIEKLNSGSGDKLNLLLTDYYPNADVISEINQSGRSDVRYQSESLDATDIGKAPVGLKTMIASFHHMDPAQAKKILQSAQANKQPILIYEVAKNNIPTLVWWLFLPLSLCILILMSLVFTLMVRPLTFKQLLFTYLIPVVPIIYAWDGQASLMRTYTADDLESMIADFRDENYQWEIADAKNNKGKGQGYYIMGYPK